MPVTTTLNDYYMAVAHTVRDRMQHLFVNTVAFLREKNTRIVSYLSAEFLMGPQLANNLLNLGLYDLMATALQQTGLELGKIIAHEVEPGLGNGGLAAWPPAIWTLWPLYRCRPSAMAFDMSLACSTRIFVMAGNGNPVTGGCTRVIPGKSRN